MATQDTEHPALAAVKKSGTGKVKVAVSDIDGVLRGKYLHIDKFLGAAQPHPGGGFGFCDVVFGWDSSDVTYDNTVLTGWQHGFPDALARLDLNTHRNVPWDGDVPFFLGDFVDADGGEPSPICPRQTLKRVLKRAEKLVSRRCAEWNSSGSTSSRRRRAGPRSRASPPSRSRRGCSATRCCA